MSFLLFLVVLILVGGAAEYFTYSATEGGIVTRALRNIQNRL